MKSNISLKAKENGQGIVLGDEETQLQFHYFWLLQKKQRNTATAHSKYLGFVNKESD